LDDVNSLDTGVRAAILDRDSYEASRPFGLERREVGSNGLLYPSVRHDSGQCVAAFWPDIVGIPIQERHLQYEWDGTKVSRYFDYRRENWFVL
jgi:RES domain